jgi:4'-phosphopantetheinyl transferase EntD
VIAELLPPSVRGVETDGDPIPADPCAEELESLGRVAERRLQEFLLARQCARRALLQLGLDPRPVRVGPDRRPLWPDGVVGSITHCPGYRAAAVALRARVVGVGIDAELNEPLPPSTVSVVISADEREATLALPRIDVAWDRLIFSAKESVYKLWYPIMRSWLDFDGARVAIQPDPSCQSRGAFSARLLAPLVVDGRDIAHVQGRFVANTHRIITAIVVDAASAAATSG